MSLPFDSTLKTLIEYFPEDWLRLLNLTAAGPVKVISADVSTTSSQADRVIFIGGKRPWILHIEVQVSRDRNLPSRLLRYNVLLSERHGVPVFTIVILLRPDADGPELSGQAVRELPERGQYLDFRYQILRVWQESPDTFLDSGPGLMPLAPLAKGTVTGLPKIIRQMERLIGAEADKPTANDLWTATYVLMGLRYKPEATAEVLKGVRDLEESATYQVIIQKGEARGREQGHIEGLIEGEARGASQEARRVLLRMGRKRLGEPTVPMLAAVNAVDDVETLETMIERVLEVENWHELFAP